MEARAHFDDAHPLLSLTDFFAILIYHLFINWNDRINKLRDRCLPFLQCLADSFAALDERNNNKTCIAAKLRSASLAIRNGGAAPGTPTAASTAAANSSSSCVLVTREEIGMVMAKMGLQQPHQGDDDDAAVVGSIDDIPSLFEDKEPSFEEIREAFQVFDRNGDGYIDAQELNDVLSVLGFQEGSSMDSCKEMIAAFDNDRDGRVDFHDFVRLMENSFDC